VDVDRTPREADTVPLTYRRRPVFIYAICMT